MDTKPLAVRETPIPGMFFLDIPVHGDNRGWFKENWQREKMVALGLPDFNPVQNNISFNEKRGATRGIHAEPWDKYLSVATGKIFGAWVDLREGGSFGTVFTAELDASTAIFVPRGVGNSYQTLEDGTAYVYLVNDHWSSDAQAEYTFLNLADETAAIQWPIPLSRSELSEKDLAHPRLAEVSPMKPKRTLVLGANGQIGRALQNVLPEADIADRSWINLSDLSSFERVQWNEYDTIINAAAYTNVDIAETQGGRAEAWSANVTALSALSQLATTHNISLVHISSDYVFDGTKDTAYTEEDAVCPLGVYGQSKAAGDAIVAAAPKHYIVRTSWVIGDGNNFVRTMISLALRGVKPTVVNDQVGRLSFAEDVAAGICHLLSTRPPYGVYNVTNAGDEESWFDVAQQVFRLTGQDPARVTGVDTDTYFADKLAAPRPKNSKLDLGKIHATGFAPRHAGVALAKYVCMFMTSQTKASSD